MQYLELLGNWFSKNRIALEKQGFTISLVRTQPMQGPSVYVDIDINDIISRVIVWSSGAVHLEAFKDDSTEQLIVEAHQVGSSKELIELMEGFLSRLALS